jgi:Icc-related predicted phosphoesterase
MDAEYTDEFRRKFDEDDVNQRREKILENINRHFYKKIQSCWMPPINQCPKALDLC